MTGVRDIPFLALFIFYSLPLIVALCSFILKLKIGKRLLIASLRMTIQLGLVALYLEALFRLNHPLVTIAYLLLMIIVASVSSLTGSKLKPKRFLLPVGLAIALPQGIILVGFVVLAGGIEALGESRYLIPIGGMLLGNALRGTVIGLTRFWGGIRENRKQYEYALALGASRFQASAPWFRSAITEAISPTLATMATIGLVSLPGMMTGQILGGSDPSTAIKYQLAIMLAIFAGVFFSLLTALLASTPIGFDTWDRLDERIFRD